MGLKATKNKIAEEIQLLPTDYKIPDFIREYLYAFSFAGNMLAPIADDENRKHYDRISAFYSILSSRKAFYDRFGDCNNLECFKRRVHGLLKSEIKTGTYTWRAVPQEIIDQCETYIKENLV